MRLKACTTNQHQNQPAKEEMEDGIGEKTSGGSATGEPDEPARDAGEAGARGAYILPAELEDFLKSLAAGEASKATPSYFC